MNPLTKPDGYEARKPNVLPTSTKALPLNANSQSSTAEIDHDDPKLSLAWSEGSITLFEHAR
jgi:hypothetical protein